MVKNKAIPLIVAASFILSSQTVFAEGLSHSKHAHSGRTIHREHKRSPGRHSHTSGAETKEHRENTAARTHRESGIQREQRQDTRRDTRLSRSNSSMTENSGIKQNNEYPGSHINNNNDSGGKYGVNNGYSGHSGYGGYSDYGNYSGSTDSLGNYDNMFAIDEADPGPFGTEPPIGGTTLRPNLVSSIEEVNNIRINGSIPQISGMNSRVADKINERIRTSFLNLVNAGHRDITASYEIFNWGGITSIVVRYSTAASRQIVNTFVFDTVSKNEVSLRSLFGRDFISYINRRIAEVLRADKEEAFESVTGFSTIRAGQSFYVSDGNIHIIFDQAHIAPAARGPVEFVLPIERLNYTLSANQFIEKDGITFVSAVVARRFGMEIDVVNGIMQIRNNGIRADVNVHNELKNPHEVRYINGVDVALSEEFFKRELGINFERGSGAREIIASHVFQK